MTDDDATNLTDAFANGTDAASRSELSSMADYGAEAYRPYLDGLDLTEAQADELMRIVWNIMRLFVEMDLPFDTCGQVVRNILDPNLGESDSIE